MLKIKYYPLLVFSYLANPLLQKFWYYVHLLWLAWMWYWYWVNNQWHAKKIIYKKFFNKNKSFTIFDVWANIWQTIDEILESKFNNFRVYSFEPQIFNYNILIEKYSHIENIQLFDFWFSDTSWTIDIFKDIDWDTGWSITTNVKENKIIETIKIDTIDSFCMKNNIKSINYLKMDIEWAEYSAIKWAKNMIDSWNIDVIEFEFLRQNISSRVFMKDFWDLLWENYDFYRILPHNIYRIKTYSHLLEIYCLSNFVCIKKWLQ